MENRIDYLLDRLTDNFEYQRVKLIKTNMNANEERGGVFIGEEVEFDLNIELIVMGISEEIINKENKNTIYGNFKFSLQ